MYLSADQTGYASGSIPFDVVAFDTDGYWDGIGKQFVVPSGKAGLYLVSLRLDVEADPGETSVQIVVYRVGAGAFIYAPIAAEPGQNWQGVATSIIDAAVGDAFSPQAAFDVSSTVSIVGDGTDTESAFAIAYLGPLT